MLATRGGKRRDHTIRAQSRSRLLRRLALIGCVGLIGGCSGPQSMFDHAGPEAAAVIRLWWLLASIGALVLLITIGFLVVGLFRSPTDPDNSASENRLGRGMLAGGLATVLLLLVILVATHRYSQPFAGIPKGNLTIEVVGKRWWWEVTYFDDDDGVLFTTANEIHIPAGFPVRIRLRATDVIHSFWVPELGGKVDLVPGRENFLWLQADEPGVFRGQCAEYCGAQHAKMAFLVIAMPPADFAEWRRAQAAPAMAPSTELARRGREVFANSACADCHTIRGVSSKSTLGPDLTHLASRRTLAAASIPNRKGHLAGWMADPQSVKPGNLMPPVPLDAQDFRALLHYLETLE